MVCFNLFYEYCYIIYCYRFQKHNKALWSLWGFYMMSYLCGIKRWAYIPRILNNTNCAPRNTIKTYYCQHIHSTEFYIIERKVIFFRLLICLSIISTSHTDFLICDYFMFDIITLAN